MIWIKNELLEALQLFRYVIVILLFSFECSRTSHFGLVHGLLSLVDT